MDFFRELLVLPLKLILFVNRYVKMWKNIHLSRWVWKIGNNIQDACRYIHFCVREKGITDAEKTAADIFKITGDARIIACICSISIGVYRNTHHAETWIQKVNDTGCSNPQMLLLTKLTIATIKGDYRERDTLIKEILDRNDLPGAFTSNALIEKARIYIEHAEWEKAEEIADNILHIMENPSVRWIKWMCCRNAGNENRANTHFLKFKKLTKEPDQSYLLGMGYYYLGDKEHAKQAFITSINNGLNKELINRNIREFIENSP